MFLKENYKVKNIFVEVKPIIQSRFRKLQETGLEAQLYFMNNYGAIDIFKNRKDYKEMHENPMIKRAVTRRETN